MRGVLKNISLLFGYNNNFYYICIINLNMIIYETRRCKIID